MHCICMSIFIYSLDWNKYDWTGIGNEEAFALADALTKTTNFKTLQ